MENPNPTLKTALDNNDEKEISIAIEKFGELAFGTARFPSRLPKYLGL